MSSIVRILTSKHGRRLGLTKDGVTVSQAGFAAGGQGKPGIVLPGSPDVVAVFDDFTGPGSRKFAFDTGGDFITEKGDDLLFAGNGSFIGGYQDTGQKLTQPAVNNGVARLTSSATSGQTPITGALSIHGQKNFKANQGNLRMAARVKVEQLSGSNVFVGFTDTGGSEMPVYDTGSAASAILTPADDFVGWLYSGAPAVATLGRNVWRAVSGKAGTDQVSVPAAPYLGLTVVANVYDVPEVEVDKSGNATFYMNGKPITSISNAVTATVGLAPAVYYSQTEAAAKFVDTDWANASADRDTGE